MVGGVRAGVVCVAAPRQGKHAQLAQQRTQLCGETLAGVCVVLGGLYYRWVVALELLRVFVSVLLMGIACCFVTGRTHHTTPHRALPAAA
jgi:hypothetical protein